MALYGAVLRHSAPIEYEHENMDEDKNIKKKMFNHKVFSNQVNKPTTIIVAKIKEIDQQDM